MSKRRFTLFLQTFSPEDTKELPSTVLEPVLDKNALSPPTSSSTSSQKQPRAPKLVLSSEEQSPDTEQQRTPEVSHHTLPLEEDGLSYAFSPPAVLQTPETKEESKSTAQALTTPSLQYIFSPPLTRSMARRRSSGITSRDSYGRLVLIFKQFLVKTPFRFTTWSLTPPHFVNSQLFSLQPAGI